MELYTVEELKGRNYKYLGAVKGNTVRAKNVFSDIGAGLKNIVGGKLGAYIKLLTDAREEAEGEMIKDAERLGADAVIGVRYTTSSVMQGASEMLVYGTAIKFED